MQPSDVEDDESLGPLPMLDSQVAHRGADALLRYVATILESVGDDDFARVDYESVKEVVRVLRRFGDDTRPGIFQK